MVKNILYKLFLLNIFCLYLPKTKNMKIYKYGFFYKNVKYGWLNKGLYRLPYKNKSNYSFVLKKLEPIIIGNKIGYRIGGDRKTIEQLKDITIPINHIEYEIKDKECPF